MHGTDLFDDADMHPNPLRTFQAKAASTRVRPHLLFDLLS